MNTPPYLRHDVRSTSAGAVVKFDFDDGTSRYLFFSHYRPHPEAPQALLQGPKVKAAVDPKDFLHLLNR